MRKSQTALKAATAFSLMSQNSNLGARRPQGFQSPAITRCFVRNHASVGRVTAQKDWSASWTFSFRIVTAALLRDNFPGNRDFSKPPSIDA